MARPELPSGAVPRLAVPSKKVTVPVGATLLAGVTFAVKLTERPAMDGFAELMTAVEVGWRTSCASGGDWLPEWKLSPG